jgi:hypothetical protein
MPRKIPFIPPERSTIAKAVQPNYRKWEAVKVGMSRSEVTAVLGDELTGREQQPHQLRDVNYARYGFISYPALPHKWAMLFVLGFNQEGRVWLKQDPFGGSPLSRTGKPSKPQIIAPQSASTFAHYPRLLDLRWIPSSGVYPLVYELEEGWGNPGSDRFRAAIDPRQHGQPFAMLSFAGAQPGRVRVRGRNAKGVGPWSDYVEFTFVV